MIQTILLFVFGYIILEMTLLITLGRALGLFWTLALVLGAGFAGAWLARREGLRSSLRLQRQMAAGALPASELTDGVLIAIAAVLLIIPGVLGDVIGLALLFPPTRSLVKAALAAKFAKVATIGRFTVDQAGPMGAAPRGSDRIVEARVIETRVVDE
jgi:UPF0716 protein FxsA